MKSLNSASGYAGIMFLPVIFIESVASLVGRARVYERCNVMLLILACFCSGSAFAVNITGTVTTTQNRAVSGVTVTATVSGANSPTDSTVTDAFGDFLLAVPAGTYDVKVLPAAGSGLAIYTLPAINVTQNRALNVILAPARVTWTGVLRDGHGTPLPNQQIKLQDLQSPGTSSAVTAANGSFTVHAAPGSYSVEISGTAATGGSLVPSEYTCVISRFGLIRDTTGSIELPDMVNLDVTVQDTLGNPVPGTSLSASGNPSTHPLGRDLEITGGTQTGTAVTDSAGHAQIKLFYGYVKLTATPPAGSGLQAMTLSQSVFASQPVAVELSAGVTWSGVLRDGHGTPVPNQQIKLQDLQGPGTSSTVTAADGSFTVHAARGSYSVEISGTAVTGGGLVPSEYTCVISHFGFSRDTIGSIELPDMVNLDVTVQDTLGNLIAGASLSAPGYSSFHTLGDDLEITSATQTGTAVTDGAGHAQVKLFYGQVNLTATPPTGSGLQAVTLPQQVFRNESTVVELSAGVTWSGVLRALHGTPVPNQQIKLQDLHGPGTSSTVTAADGSFAVHAAQGSYSIEISGTAATGIGLVPGEYTCGISSFGLNRDRTGSIDLPPTVNLDVTVQDSLGNPIAGTSLSALGTLSFPGFGDDLEITSATQTGTGVTDNLGKTQIKLFAGYVALTVVPPPPSGFSPENITALRFARDTQLLIVMQPPNSRPDAKAGPDQVVEATSPTGASVTLNGSASSDPEGQTLSYLWKEGATTIATGVNPTLNLSLGTHVITLNVIDTLNALDSDQVLVQIRDTTAPTLTCPEDLTVEATSISGATVTFAGDANDVVDGNVTPVCSPVSGSTFPVGVTAVNCTATDTAGNQSSCSFNVTVHQFAPTNSSYTNDIPPGYSLIANQLDHGSNTLDDIFPNMPDGASLTIYSRTACDVANTYTYDTGFGGWVDAGFNPIDPSSVSLVPGAAAFFFNPGSSTTLVFTGSPHVPVLPAALACGRGHSYFLSRQTNGVGTYENITGLPPEEGAMLLRWTGSTFQTNLYTGGEWQPTNAAVRIGEGVIAYVPTLGRPSITNQPSSLTVTQGQTATFTIGVVGTSPLFYEWYHNNGRVLTAQDDRNVISNAQPADAGSYFCVVSNSSGSATSAVATLNVVPQSAIDPANCCATCAPPYPASYSVVVQPGLNFFANVLCRGTNTLSALLPNAPDNATVYRWDPQTQDFDPNAATYSASAGQWFPDFTLGLGEGFTLVNPGSPYTNNFFGCESGCPLPCGPTNNACQILGALGLGVSTWTNLYGCPPTCGTTLGIWNVNNQDWDTFTYLNASWSPATPSWGVGQAVKVCVQTNVSCLPCAGVLSFVCPTNKTVECSAAWSFDAVTATNDCCGSNITITTQNTVANVGSCPSTYTRTWLITDCSTNTAMCSQTITVSSATPCTPGETWTPREGNRNWISVASSANGSKVVAVANSGQIYTSIDFGATWVPRDSNRNWWAVASSADGSKLVAGAPNDQIYTSNDSGVTWTPRDSNRNWLSVASSADGSKLVAGSWGGVIYTSTDSGVTWTARDSNRFWWAVASSADGSRLVAVVNGGQIYTSTDSGVTWTPRESSRNWASVGSSADGSKLVAGVNGGQIYTSTDSGVTWTPRESSRNWLSVASSTDGSKLVAGALNGQIYTSTDSGVTWIPRENNRVWRSVSSSADGSKLVAGVLGGQIYTSVCQSALVVASATNKTVEFGSAWGFDEPAATSTCCLTNVTLSILATMTNGVCPQIVTRTWQATDCCGNTNTCSQSVTIVETMPPVITSWPTNRVLLPDFVCVASVPDMTGEVVATDNFLTFTVAQNPAAGTSLFGSGPHPVVFTVCNACTNCITGTNYVTLNCTSPGRIVINKPSTNVVISWSGTGTLQSSTNLSPPFNWTDATTNSPFTNPTTSGQQFFRLRP